MKQQEEILRNNQSIKKQQKILEVFMNQEKKFSNFIIIMLKLHLKLSTKQNMERDLKY